MDRHVKMLSVGLASIVVAALLAQAAPGGEMGLDDAFKKLATHKFGESRIPLTVISDAVRDSAKSPPDRQKLAARLAAVLGSDATPDAKRFVCRELSLIGTAAEVPALAKLLTDKDLSDMGRYALERIPGDEAVAAIRDALDKVGGKAKIGMINSLGERHDAKAVGDLVKIMNGEDADAAEAAAAALGKIDGEEALAALSAARAKAPDKLKPAVTNALLVCADKLVADGKKEAAIGVYEKLYVPAEPVRVQIAALRGLVSAKGAAAAGLVIEALRGKNAQLRAAASGYVRAMPGEDVTKAFAAELGKLPADAKVLVLAALADRGDKAALPAVVEELKDSDAAVRAAALAAVGALGDASCVDALTKALAGKDKAESDAAAAALRRVAGQGVDAAIAKAIAAAEAKIKVELLRALAARKATAATAEVLQAAQDADPAVRAEAIKALAQIANPDALDAMVKLLLKANEADQAALGASIAIVARGVADEDKRVAPILSALKDADAKAKAALLMALGRIGSTKALSVVKDSLKDPSADVQEAAVRALSNWPDEGAAPELLAVAKTSADPKLQILAIRGLVDVVGRMKDDNLSAQKALALLAEAMDAAKRPDEKKRILGAVANVKQAKAVALLTKYLDDDALKNEAAAGIFKLFADRKLRNAKEFRAARAGIEANFKDKRTLDQAAKLPK